MTILNEVRKARDELSSLRNQRDSLKTEHTTVKKILKSMKEDGRINTNYVVESDTFKVSENSHAVDKKFVEGIDKWMGAYINTLKVEIEQIETNLSESKVKDEKTVRDDVTHLLHGRALNTMLADLVALQHDPTVKRICVAAIAITAIGLAAASGGIAVIFMACAFALMSAKYATTIKQTKTDAQLIVEEGLFSRNESKVERAFTSKGQSLEI